MSLVLYQGAISTCSQKVRLALAEKSLCYERIDVNVPAREHLTEAYLSLNPNGVVPTLVHDGQPIIDSSVICEYLDDAFPTLTLTPSDARGRAAMRAWMRYFEEVPTAAIRVPSFNRVLVRDFLSPARLEEMRARSPLRRHFYRDLGPNGFPEEQYRRSIERLSDCLRRVDGALQNQRPYLLGQLVSIADIVLLPTLVRMEDIGLTVLWKDYPAVASWFGRMKDRSSFAEAYYPGSRLQMPAPAQNSDKETEKAEDAEHL